MKIGTPKTFQRFLGFEDFLTLEFSTLNIFEAELFLSTIGVQFLRTSQYKPDHFKVDQFAKVSHSTSILYLLKNAFVSLQRAMTNDSACILSSTKTIFTRRAAGAGLTCKKAVCINLPFLGKKAYRRT